MISSGWEAYRGWEYLEVWKGEGEDRQFREYPSLRLVLLAMVMGGRNRGIICHILTENPATPLSLEDFPLNIGKIRPIWAYFSGIHGAGKRGDYIVF